MDPLLRVVVPDLHHQAAVEAAVQGGQVAHGDGEVAMVVGHRFQPVALGQVLAGVGLVAAVVQVEVLEREVADGPALRAHLHFAPRAAVPGLVVGHVVPFGHGAQDPAGEGDVLPLRTHIQGIRRGDLEGCHQTCSERQETVTCLSRNDSQFPQSEKNLDLGLQSCGFPGHRPQSSQLTSPGLSFFVSS